MTTMNRVITLIIVICLAACSSKKEAPKLSLTLIPPTTITDKVNLDIRAAIRNLDSSDIRIDLLVYLDEEKENNLLHKESMNIAKGDTGSLKYIMPTKDRAGEHKILLKIKGEGFEQTETKKINILSSSTRSTKTIGGAWISFYHWSETEGKMWNPAIKNLTDDQWKEMMSGMHNAGMDIVVIQESFRNQDYVGQHNMQDTGYKGKAFYPSKLYTERMPLVAKDPVEAVLSASDSLDMHVFMGVGMYAWFDYTAGSLDWHKKVATELWEKYGHHKSFYGFYVSEEGMGSLDCFEKDSSKHDMRRKEVLDFFKEFNTWCKKMAPDKPVMFAPNGWGVGRAKGAYAELLKNVDIISPFAFARMPEGDLSGEEAIALLQKYCDDAQAHLWLDLEAFLFNEKEGYLYPRPMTEIKSDLDRFTNFEKIICYQYPGVFNSPDASVRVGEPSTIQLYKDYLQYLKTLSK
ncbi:MAG: DUF4434 domain-containing protein [Chitinophagaceae bacterium]|nr:DUF4434 domain-containing protein [Chitinophagaceae bacterium]